MKKFLIVLVVIIAAFVGYVAMQPSEFQISRSATIAATPDAVFAQVNDFHNWGSWDPWAKMDPNAKSTFDGPPAGTGASLAWAGNEQVGEGKMTITESKPPELVRIKLEFIKPFASVADAEFTFKPEGNQTTVTWTMSGKNNFISKAFCVFMNMDKTVGGDFEKGLASMKAFVETAATKEPAQ
ncbi:MAG TPA: SRPBCC family protein [Kiritimatiellia bacterium]|jgi:uncharacterized protein YndB with AHSA1/START domain